jgi:DNA-binding transcriptional MocR family regulator
VPAAEPSSIAKVADGLRAEIYSGAKAPGAQLPTRQKIADETGLSPESAGTALRMLRDEGLVVLRQGGGTFVLPRDLYEVAVTIEYAGTAKDWRGASSALARAMAAAAGYELAASDARTAPLDRQGAVITVIISVARGRMDAALARALVVVGPAAAERDSAGNARWAMPPVRAEVRSLPAETPIR